MPAARWQLWPGGRALRLHVPLAITFLVGAFMLVQFFVPHKVGQDLYDSLLAWARIIGAFAMVLGVGSLFQRHVDRIRRRRQEWGYSVVTLLSFALMVTVGFAWGKEKGTPFDWMFTNVQVPLDATMFSLLAFFVASAAYRSFRARSPRGDADAPGGPGSHARPSAPR